MYKGLSTIDALKLSMIECHLMVMYPPFFVSLLGSNRGGSASSAASAGATDNFGYLRRYKDVSCWASMAHTDDWKTELQNLAPFYINII